MELFHSLPLKFNKFNWQKWPYEKISNVLYLNWLIKKSPSIKVELFRPKIIKGDLIIIIILYAIKGF